MYFICKMQYNVFISYYIRKNSCCKMPEQSYIKGLMMESINTKKIIDELNSTLNKKIEGNSAVFESIKISPAAQKGYSVKIENISMGKGIKKLINKIALKMIKKSLIQMMDMQNSINRELIGKIDSMHEQIDYLKTELKCLKEKNNSKEQK